LVDTTQELDDLKNIEEELRINLELKSGQNAKLDSVIQLRNLEIQKKVAQIRGLLNKGKVTQTELASASQQIASFKDQVSQLKAEIEELSTQNQYLKDENYVMQKQIEAEREINQEIRTQNTELVKQVEVGSRIFLKSLVANPMRNALVGDYKATYKLSKLEKIEVSCTLGNNDLVEKGDKTLYFQVITPNKSTLHSDNNSSGTFNFDGGDRMYTVKKGVNFQNRNETISFAIPKTDGMTAGSYTVNVFSQNHKMGSTEFTLR
jgi:TolA-binding protein